MSLPHLVTDRLWLEPVSSAHLPLLVELNADTEVMRHLLGRAATPEETAAEWAMRLDTHTDTGRGLGYWAGYEDGSFVGWWSASSHAADPGLRYERTWVQEFEDPLPGSELGEVQYGLHRADWLSA